MDDAQLQVGAEQRPMSQSEMVTAFMKVQGDLNTLVQKIEKRSVYAAQSAAFRDLRRWIAKAEGVKQGLIEMRL